MYHEINQGNIIIALHREISCFTPIITHFRPLIGHYYEQ